MTNSNDNNAAKLSLFDFNGHDIRAVKIGGKPWFVAADVCRVLGLYIKGDGTVNVWNAKSGLDAGQHRVHVTPFQKGGKLTVISESGLYKLVMRSEKPQAEPFQNWVTKVVLPAIRKDGMYVMGEEKVRTGEMSLEEMELLVIEGLRKKIVRLTQERDTGPHRFALWGRWGGCRL